MGLGLRMSSWKTPSTYHCSAGSPPPQLNWWREHALVDGSYEEDQAGKTVNSLMIENLQRSDLHSILTCQASNNNISNPVSNSVKIDMHCRTPESAHLHLSVSTFLFSRTTQRYLAGHCGDHVCWQEIRGSVPSCWGETLTCCDLVERNSSDQRQHHHHGQWDTLYSHQV